MQANNSKNKINFWTLLIIAAFFLLSISPVLLISLLLIIIFTYFVNKQKFAQLQDLLGPLLNTRQQSTSLAAQSRTTNHNPLVKLPFSWSILLDNLNKQSAFTPQFNNLLTRSKLNLNIKKKYLQVALNGSLAEAENIARILPQSDKILIEVGTPLIKTSGSQAIRSIVSICPNAYVVADTKTADLAERDVEMVVRAGARAATCLGVAPIETINMFIAECNRQGIDAMIDMMNVARPLAVLKKLKKLPQVVILHRGVDETEQTKGKIIPYYQINQIKGNYNVMLSVAGGDSIREVQSSIFNGANIVVVWKDFMTANQGVSSLASSFLKEIK